MTYADIKRDRATVRKQQREERITKEHKKAQKIYGTIMIVIGVLSAIISEGDITAAMMLCPAGCYLCATREDMFEEKEEE